MTGFEIDGPEFNRYFYGAGKPGMNYCSRKANQIETQARANASGPIIGIKTGRLKAYLRSSTVIRGGENSYAEVGTSATSNLADAAPEGFELGGGNFSYPAWHDQHGRPWLTNAVLASGFRRKS